MEWRAVVGYEGSYEVSSQGQIRSVPRMGTPGKVLKPKLTRKGHPYVTLSVGNVQQHHYIHALVAQAWLGPRPDGAEVRHLDGRPDHNVPSNLAYGTSAENKADSVRHGTHANARKTHCAHGHEYDEENTRVERRGSRACRACDRERDRLRYAATRTPPS